LAELCAGSAQIGQWLAGWIFYALFLKCSGRGGRVLDTTRVVRANHRVKYPARFMVAALNPCR
jgi:hypothetical protein